MPYYRAVYANNVVISCTELSEIPEPAIDFASDASHNIHYQHKDGKMVFAYIKADDPAEAARLAAELAHQIQQQTP